MKLTFLGTGTSQGMPVIACGCDVCQSTDSLDQRLRASALLEADGVNIVFDSGPDFRQQMLREKVVKLDAIIFTHEHKDHTGGLDDIRAYNYISSQAMDVYAEPRVQASLRREYGYIFAEMKYPGVPDVRLHTISDQPFEVGGVQVTPVRVLHYKLPVLSFRIKDFAYITDANYIREEEKLKLQNLEVLVVNALRIEKHMSHFNLEEALELVAELKPKRTYLTHISHLLGFHKEVTEMLPENVFLAYDGLKIEI